MGEDLKKHSVPVIKEDFKDGKIIEEDIKYFVDLLGHDIQTEIRTFEGGKYAKKIYCSSYFEILNEVKKITYEQKSLYFGIHERAPNKSGNDSVISCKIIPIDVDAKDFIVPKEDSKIRAINDDEYDEYKLFCNILDKFLLDNDLKPSCKISSGHGTHWYIEIPKILNKDILKNTLIKFKNIMKSTFNGKVDTSVYNQERVMRIPGTWNFKRKPFVLSKITEKSIITEAEKKKNIDVINNFIIKNSEEKESLKDKNSEEKSNSKQNFLNSRISCVKLLEHFGHNITTNPTKCLIPQEDGEPHTSESNKNLAWDEAKGLITCFHNGCCGKDGNNVMNIVSFTSNMLKLKNSKAVEYLFNTFIKNYKDDEESLSNFVQYIELYGKMDDKLKSQEEVYDYINKTLRVVVNDAEEKPSYFVVKGGMYLSNGKRHIMNLIDRLYGLCSNENLANKILFKFKNRCMKTMEELNTVEPNLILCNNTFIRVTRDNIVVEKIDDNKPRWFKLKINYDKDKKIPTKILKIFDGIFDKEYLPQIQEFLGYLLYFDNPRNKIFWFVAPSDRSGSNGKSLFMNFVDLMFHDKDVTNLTIQQIAESNFLVHNLLGKPVNMGRDIPDTKIENSSTIKMISGEDRITADVKFKEKIDFKFFGKCIFGCNTIPDFADKTDSIARRNFPIEFKYQFLSENELTKIAVYKKPFCFKKDTSLKGNVYSDGELSGFLNWCLEGLQRLMKNDFEFTLEPSLQDVKLFWLKNTSTVNEFLIDYTEPDYKNKIPEEEFSLNYIHYCRDRGITCSSVTERNRVLRNSYICDFTRIMNKSYIRGVRWKQNKNVIKPDPEKKNNEIPFNEVITIGK